MASKQQKLTWWQRGVIYQIWVRSFYDSDGDGNGDLAGVIAKLDYLRWLGVDVLWLSPIYPSPMVESGYDVEDYTGVHPLYGGLATFDELLAAAHERGLRVILDFVPSHTSNCHPWFEQARSGRDNPRRDWYLWADPGENGAPPSNWISAFGGSAWTYDPTTEQFYEHAFLPQQPDLNWRNPAVQRAVLDAMGFWLERGVDGFRMDAVWHMIKDDRLRDNPPNPDYTPDMPPDNVVIPTYTRDRPEVHGVLAAMRQAVDRFSDRVLGGELYMGAKEMMPYYGTPERPELHIPFNLQLSVLPWEAGALGEFIGQYMAALPAWAWPNWAISTHDSRRIVGRAGPRGARMAALLLLTLPGTPTVYYGEEIGMPNVDIPHGEVEDPRALLSPYLGLGRDPARTPMRWHNAPSAGFTTGEPWLPVGGELEHINVAAQSEDPRSMLSLYRRLIALRRETPALQGRGFRMAQTGDTLLAYERSGAGRRLLVALNFGAEPQQVELPGRAVRLLLSTEPERAEEQVADGLELRPEEGVIVDLED
ncbi:MAG TPA: alpha-amylase family glycosyl hydrolase [Roseiflexaceae bacterium]|nr:alpha-amylase family glycosyl hydrolase [Roseiflexaceae bacterium]